MEDSALLPNPRGSPPQTKRASDSSSNGEKQSAQSASGDWRPLSLTKPVLLATLALSLLLFACIEILAQRSQKKGGLAFYPSVDDIPGHISFAYNYAPTIIATFFSLLWSWIDLDVKRVQPWIVLSRPGGAIAGDSILLDYSSDLLPYAPIRAAKLKHWPVFSSGAAAVLILWVLTPLQATLFGTVTLSQITPTIVAERSQLLPPDEQLKSETFLQFSYSIAVLNQSYPAFTTAKYALLPFYIQDRPSLSTATANWTAETTKLWAEADCSSLKSAFVEINDYREFEYNITGHRGCMANVTFVAAQSTPKLEYADNTEEKYDGIEDWICFKDPDKPYYNNKDRYYSNTSYSAAIYWSERILNPKNATQVTGFNISGIQCGLSYHKQQVMVTIDSKTLQPYHDTIVPISEQTNLTSSEFNNATFTPAIPVDSISNDNEADSTWPLSQDYAETVFPSLQPTMSGGSPLELIFRYAVLGRNYSMPALYDQSEQHTLFQDVIQQWFSLAISTRLTNQTTGLGDSASSTVLLTSIVVSRPFAIASEVLLLLSVLVLGYLSYCLKPSACALEKIPSSIGDLIDLAHNNLDTVKLFQPLDTANEALMKQALGKITLRVATDGSSGCSKLLMVEGSIIVSDEEDNNMTAKPHYKPIKPWILRRGTGAVLALALVAAVVVLSYFKCMEKKYNGLPRPSENFEVLQLLENYIPTAFSTIIEPFWVLLARTMCIFQPFKDLWKGRAPANRSIDATYTSVPPQLALLKSILSRKLLLSLLCLAAFLANVLAIGLSALFNERPEVINFDQEFEPLYQSRLNSSTILDFVDQGSFLPNQKTFMFTVYANMSENVQLPPWVSTQYYFQPVKVIGADDKSAGDEYTVRTRGFGADLKCTPYPASSHILWPNPYSALPNQYNLSCIDPIKEVLSSIILDRSGTEFGDDKKASIMSSGYSYLTYVRDQPSICGPNVTFGWARAPEGLKQNKTILTTYAQCQPLLQTAMFETTIDRDGYVLRYHRVSDLKSSLDYSNATHEINLLLALFNSATADADHEWRDVPNIRTWIAQYMSMDLGSRNFTDPDLSVPDPEALIPTLRRVYSRLFPAFMSNATNILSNTESKTSIMGTRHTEETRIFMDKTAFIITITVLAIDLLIALAFYLPESLYVFPRLPSSAGCILAYIAPSRAVRDGTPVSGWKHETFSFGRYIGHNGKSYIGVDLDKYVVERDTSLGTYKPLFSKNPFGNILSGKRDGRSQSS